MRDELPRERLGSAMALMSSSIGVGGGLALPLAALVAQNTDWHALFYGAAGLGVLVDRPHPRRRTGVPSCARRAPSTYSARSACPPACVLFLLPDHQGQRLGLGLAAPRSACSPRRPWSSSSGA